MEHQTLQLPTDEGAWKEWVTGQARDGLRDAGAGAEALRAAADGDPAILQLWNDVQLALSDVLALTSVMTQVHPDPAVVDAAEALEIEARELATDLHLDDTVFARLRSLDAEELDAGAARVLRLTVRDFRRAGVDREPEERDRLRALRRQESELTLTFERNIRDGRRVSKVAASALIGLPEDYRADHQPDEHGLVEISTDYPDLHPFLTHSRDAVARQAVVHSYLNLGWPDNDAVLAELLHVREEIARLLGYDDWPSYDAEVKMIAKGPEIPAFIDSLAEEAREVGRGEIEVLLETARAEGEDTVDVANWRHLMELVKRERFGVDGQEVRRYLHFDKVLRGLLDVTSRLFGLRYEPVDAPTWHSDVSSYDVLLEESGKPLGRIHLDLHPRERKFNHAAQFGLVTGVLDRQLPEGVLVCNLARGLLTHGEVVTLFHEFGHLIHEVVGGHHPWVRFSGVATEWDFVEAPSQLLEEWAWDADVLRTFATDEDGEPIPRELVARMRAADEFGKGFLTCTQMAYAAISYWLHHERPEDLTGRVRELMERYSLIGQVPDTHFQTGFGHLNDYGSGYYTYAWSLVIAKDLFSAFDPGDLFAAEAAHRYRDTVLAPGGSKDAADLVHDFLGRPYDNRAFKAWLHATPEADQ